jgi:glycosyltransferase involved in cell wall biosynthesis
MPVRNGERHLETALGSLAEQTYEHLEILVSDNASTDSTASIARRIERADARVRYVRHDEPISGYDNFQWVLDQTRGRYFMWAAHDDVWDPHHVARLVERLERHEEAALATAGVVRVIDQDGTCLARLAAFKELSHPSRAVRLEGFVAQDEALGKANLFYALFRRSVLESLGGVSRLRPPNALSEYQLLFLAVAAGDVAIDPDLEFGKRVNEAPQRPRLVRGLVGSVRAYRVVNGYRHVARDQAGLSSEEIALVDAAVRRRLLALPRARLGRLRPAAWR